MLPIFIGELIFGIVFALVATAFKGSILDHGLVIVSIAGMSISYLVFIIFGQWFLGYYFNWFPVWGWGDIRYLALPVIIGIFSGIGGNVRFYRTVFVNELNREYLRTAAAKGCSGFSIYSKHLLRNAAIPIITRASASLPFLFTGSLLLERFFGIPGLGYLGIDALDNSDLQLLKALVIVSAMLFVGINLAADITYAWADPRIRLSK
jgi:peptide/nickel transport system permease protein